MLPDITLGAEVGMRYTNAIIGLAVVLAGPACQDLASPATKRASETPSFAAQVGRLKTFRIPSDNSQPLHITLGSDGNVWFTESQINAGKIGQVDARGRITEFAVPNTSSQPDDIVTGADGALWFTGPSGFPDFFIGRLTTAGLFTGFAPGCDPNGGCSIVPQGIARGPDGNIWFTEQIRNAIVRLTPAGVFTFFTIPTPGANPHGITAGPDGNLWFTEFNANRIGRITTAGVITEFPGVTGSPDRITAGSDGNLWFTEPFPFDSRIGRITTAGVITEFALASGAEPRDIVAGPDGNLWFTEYGAGALANITTTGVVTEVETVKGGPWGIARGADGAIWFTLVDGNRIGRFTLQ